MHSVTIVHDNVVADGPHNYGIFTVIVTDPVPVAGYLDIARLAWGNADLNGNTVVAAVALIAWIRNLNHGRHGARSDVSRSVVSHVAVQRNRLANNW